MGLCPSRPHFTGPPGPPAASRYRAGSPPPSAAYSHACVGSSSTTTAAASTAFSAASDARRAVGRQQQFLVHDVLLFIFVHLPMADRLTARLVCSAWAQQDALIIRAWVHNLKRQLRRRPQLMDNIRAVAPQAALVTGAKTTGLLLIGGGIGCGGLSVLCCGSLFNCFSPDLNPWVVTGCPPGCIISWLYIIVSCLDVRSHGHLVDLVLLAPAILYFLPSELPALCAVALMVQGYQLFTSWSFSSIEVPSEQWDARRTE
eukprot:EG_transcript_24638